jgi:hypothetical protein
MGSLTTTFDPTDVRLDLLVKLLPLPQPPLRARTDARPESHPTKECARARVSCLKTEPNYYCCPITLVMA